MSNLAAALPWITVAALLLGSLLVVLRTPLKLLDARTRLEELEHQVATLDSQLKKAVRRWGADAKRASPSDSPTSAEEPAEPGLLPFSTPVPPNQSRALSPDDQLAAIRRRMRGLS